MATKRGRKRKAWEELELVGLLEGETLRKGGQRWLCEKSILHKPLATSSYEEAATYIAQCREHEQCPKQWLFSKQGHQMAVSQQGDRAGTLNLACVKRAMAKKYSASSTPSMSQKRMEEDEVPWECRPPSWQLKNFRPSQRASRQQEAAECVGALQAWLQDPPEHVVVHDDSLVCTRDQVRIMFSFSLARDWVEKQSLPCFLMDVTWQTNRPGLVLGAIGPCGLKMWPSGKPHMRFFPVLFLLAAAEDEDAHKMLVQKYLGMVEASGVSVTDGFFDCACYNGVKAALRQNEQWSHVRLHRCLQHTRVNLKAEAVKRDCATGEPELKFCSCT